MRDENGRMVKARQGRWMFHRQALLSVLAMFAVSAFLSPASAQRPDDSYKGPSAGGGLDAQMRQFEPAPPPPAGGGARRL